MAKHGRLISLFFCLIAAAGAGAAPYVPVTRVQGTIRVWGSAQMAGLIEGWERGFARFHPGVKFENHLYGAVSAIAGLYTGVADIAVSREIWPVETLAFEQVLGYKPTSFAVATGSFDVPTKSSSLDILVHRDNPLTRLTLSQLAAIFGAAGSLRTWGDLGVRGALSGQPVHTYGYKPENAGAQLFASLIFGGSTQWNCGYRGFENQGGVDAGQQIVDALAQDPLGIAIANVHYARPAVRAVAIARAASAVAVLPSRESVQDRSYPLTRQVYIFLNRDPRKAADPRCSEFVRYVLSREGQMDVSAEGAYLPLPG
jgi:phosphate transport system substrate-binding protein